jgi:hypothetical protein
MTAEQEAEELGYFAAVCDVESCYRDITDREREELEIRAVRYRNLQLATLAEIEAVKEVVYAIHGVGI